MRSLYTQIITGLAFSLVVITLAHISGTPEITSFIRSNGLLTLIALLALNASTACFTLGRLCELETLIKKAYYFDDSKLKLRSGFLEQIVCALLLTLLIAATPATCWDSPTYWSIATIVKTLALSCITHTTYCTYDFAIGAINSTISPDRH